jgi:hypothetical protein
LACFVLLPEYDQNLVTPVVVGIAQGHVNDVPRRRAAPHLNTVLMDRDPCALELHVFRDTIAGEINVTSCKHATGRHVKWFF